MELRRSHLVFFLQLRQLLDWVVKGAGMELATTDLTNKVRLAERYLRETIGPKLTRTQRERGQQPLIPVSSLMIKLLKLSRLIFLL